MNTFRPNSAGYRAILRDGDMYLGLMPVGLRIEARAKGSAPVETPASASAHNRVPGKFRNSIHTERHRNASRVTVQVVADCEGASAIEARFHTLARSL